MPNKKMCVKLFILVCFLNYAKGDISEKLKQGQALSSPGSSSAFEGLLAPFPNDQLVENGRPSGIKGGANGRLVGSGATNSNRKVVIPFHSHHSDDDENNLDRLCKDAFHSFLCKPVGPRKTRLNGKLRPGAILPPGFLIGSSSNVQVAKEAPLESGGALLPTSLENEGGYQYPLPSNNVPAVSNSGYTYPKPPYVYEKPTNQLAYPSQDSPVVKKPSNEYLPSIPSTTNKLVLPNQRLSPTITESTKEQPLRGSTFSSFSNVVTSQTNNQPAFSNPFVYLNQKPISAVSFPSPPQGFTVLNQPATYSIPQTLATTQTLFVAPSVINPAPSPVLLHTIKPQNQVSHFPTTIVPQPPVLFTDQGSLFTPSNVAPPRIELNTNNDRALYYSPLPSNQNQVSLSTVSNLSPTQPPFLKANNGYLPPEKPTISKQATVPENLFYSPQSTIGFPTTFPKFEYPLSTPAPVIQFRTTTLQPTLITSIPTTARPFVSKLQALSTLPVVLPSTTRRTFTFPTTTIRPPTLSFTERNYIATPTSQKLSNDYLPPPGQTISKPDDFKDFLSSKPPFNNFNVQPTNQRETLITNPLQIPQLPSKEYLPQSDGKIEGSSSNLTPNIEGGSILAAEDSAPESGKLPAEKKERTHTHEEFCRDAFHSFLCKPIDKPRKRIDGRIREGAKIPSHVLLKASSEPKRQNVIPNQSGGAILPTELDSQITQPTRNQPSFFLVSESDSSNLAKQLFNSPPQYKSSFPSTPTNLNLRKTVVADLKKNLYEPVPTASVPSSLPPSLSTPRKLTSLPRKIALEPAASNDAPSLAEQNGPLFSNKQLLGQSTNSQSKNFPETSKDESFQTSSQGYNYNRPIKPLNDPTANSGYDYNKPKKQFTLPGLSSVGQQVFGQRLQPFKPTTKTNDQTHLSQTREEPLSKNDVLNQDNELPPTSQFEILKP